MQETTLIYLYKPESREILLAMKKRRFGTGKWNGVGGKLEGAETIEQNAIRETKEEICVDIDEQHLRKVGEIKFTFEGKPEWNQRVHAFFTEAWQGEPSETEEMQPKWFSIDSLPYSEMWVSDLLWLPQVLAGEKINGSLHFNNDGSKVLSHKFSVV